jgi:hypothetical protein
MNLNVQILRDPEDSLSTSPQWHQVHCFQITTNHYKYNRYISCVDRSVLRVCQLAVLKNKVCHLLQASDDKMTCTTHLCVVLLTISDFTILKCYHKNYYLLIQKFYATIRLTILCRPVVQPDTLSDTTEWPLFPCHNICASSQGFNIAWLLLSHVHVHELLNAQWLWLIRWLFFESSQVCVSVTRFVANLWQWHAKWGNP